MTDPARRATLAPSALEVRAAEPGVPGAAPLESAVLGRAGARAPTGGWRTGTVREVRHPTPRSVLLRIEVPERVDHLPGQHYVVRLTAEDGYTAQRSYSVASPPSDPLVELWVERLEGGEVSGFLADVVEPGDALQVRGPIGGWFVWDGDVPAVGVGGGSGVVPLVAMLRHARDIGREDLLQLAVAASTLPELPYADELVQAGVAVALSRADLDGRAASRLTREDLRPLCRPDTRAYVCGSAAFAESISQLIVHLGCTVPDVRVERFGPSG